LFVCLFVFWCYWHIATPSLTYVAISCCPSSNLVKLFLDSHLTHTVASTQIGPYPTWKTAVSDLQGSSRGKRIGCQANMPPGTDKVTLRERSTGLVLPEDTWLPPGPDSLPSEPDPLGLSPLICKIGSSLWGKGSHLTLRG
jgi:hypothetical protein